jgi:hypothetical protein
VLFWKGGGREEEELDAWGKMGFKKGSKLLCAYDSWACDSHSDGG